MPSTFSPLKIQLMATGENNTTWGDVTNLNLGTALEEAIVGSADVTFASADVTLTLTDTNASQTARNMRLRCTGTTGGSTRNLIVPSIEKPYIVRNDCADSVVVKTAAGTGITIPTGRTMWVYSDATNVVDAVTHLSSLTLGTSLPVSSGGTGTNTAFTAGSVVFAGASGVYSQDNANLFWDNANDRLGIGTATPAAKLDVIGNIRMPSGNSLYWAGGNEIINAVENNRMTFGVNGSERMRIDSSGNVGIGTNNPIAKLDLVGSADTYARINDGTVNLVLQSYSTGSSAIVGTTSNHPLTLWANAAERMRIISDGRVLVGTSTSPNGTAVSLTLARAGDNGLNLAYNSGGGGGASMGTITGAGLAFYTYTGAVGSESYTERMRIDSSGNVGIGTSSPGTRLDVNGTIQVRTSGFEFGRILTNNVSASTGGLTFQYNTSGTFTDGMVLNGSGNVGIGVNPIANTRLYVRTAAITDTAYYADNGANSGFKVKFASSTTSILNDFGAALVLGTNDTERMRIDASGNVGIGTSSPTVRADILGVAVGNSAVQPLLQLRSASDALSNSVEMLLTPIISGQTRTAIGGVREGATANAAIYMATNNTERMRIDSSGNVSITNGNLVIGTANKGIDFSANSHAAGMTSELLNDYEEGTFTPTLSSDGTPPTVSGYVNRYGSYTKIGNRVFISVNIRATITNAGTGTPQITGLPYASNNNALNGVSLGITDLMTVPFNANYINGSTLILALGTYNVVTSAYITFSAMYEI